MHTNILKVKNTDAHTLCHSPLPTTLWHTDWLILWWACLWHTDCVTLQQQRPPRLPPLAAPPCIHAVFSTEALALSLPPPPVPPLEDGNEGQKEGDGKRMCVGHGEGSWPHSVFGSMEDMNWFLHLLTPSFCFTFSSGFFFAFHKSG